MNGPYGFHILLLIQVLVLTLLLPGTRAVSFFVDRKEDCEVVELNFIPRESSLRLCAGVRGDGGVWKISLTFRFLFSGCFFEGWHPFSNFVLQKYLAIEEIPHKRIVHKNRISSTLKNLTLGVPTHVWKPGKKIGPKTQC